jgi:hypothetical protein
MLVKGADLLGRAGYRKRDPSNPSFGRSPGAGCAVEHLPAEALASKPHMIAPGWGFRVESWGLGVGGLARLSW